MSWTGSSLFLTGINHKEKAHSSLLYLISLFRNTMELNFSAGSLCLIIENPVHIGNIIDVRHVVRINLLTVKASLLFQSFSNNASLHSEIEISGNFVVILAKLFGCPATSRKCNRKPYQRRANKKYLNLFIKNL